MPDQKLEMLSAYLADVTRKLEWGATKYGDRADKMGLGRLMAEIEEEVVDVAAWSYWLWYRMRRLRPKVAELERRLTEL